MTKMLYEYLIRVDLGPLHHFYDPETAAEFLISMVDPDLIDIKMLYNALVRKLKNMNVGDSIKDGPIRIDFVKC